MTASYSAALAERQAEAAVTWPYGSFGEPGTITSRKIDKALGATIVQFANGSRLIVKPTAFDKDSITVSVALGLGRKGTDEKLKRALWAVPFMPIGGTAKLDVVSIQRWAQSSGLVVSANMQAGTSAFTISGTTLPADLKAEMQLLAAYVRDPGFRPELSEKTRSVGQMMGGQIEANAGAVFSREAQRVSAGGDTRFSSVPTISDIAATTAEDLPALLRPALAGPADVTIVGDVRLDDAIAAVQNTFGTGEQAARLKGPEPTVTLAAENGGPFEARHAGRADQAFYGEFWPMPDYYSAPGTSYAADVAAAVLGSRLVDLVREKLGLTYSPQVRALASIELKGQGSFGAVLETPAANFDTFHSLLAAQIAELASKPVSADELERAKRPLIESRTKDFETNGYWARNLQLILLDPKAKAPVLEQANGIRAITAADVQAIFANRLRGKTPTRVVAKAK